MLRELILDPSPFLFIVLQDTSVLQLDRPAVASVGSLYAQNMATHHQAYLSSRSLPAHPKKGQTQISSQSDKTTLVSALTAEVSRTDQHESEQFKENKQIDLHLHSQQKPASLVQVLPSTFNTSWKYPSNPISMAESKHLEASLSITGMDPKFEGYSSSTTQAVTESDIYPGLSHVKGTEAGDDKPAALPVNVKQGGDSDFRKELKMLGAGMGLGLAGTPSTVSIDGLPGVIASLTYKKPLD